ncbi:MAG: hypothetical protein M1816_005294 [Peltula sp. TS41687]|nr:MAG: hypothetical protein M1816_005294 [Peltula sp. TS41687]
MEADLLSESNLHALTSTIEKKLKDTKRSKKSKNESHDKSKPIGSKRNKQVQDGNLNLPHDSGEAKETSRGKKRAAGGKIKNATSQKEEGKHAKEERNDKLDEGSSPHAQLLKEIVALDGTEEDLVLVAELESASELEWDGLEKKRQSTDKKLRGDLTRFMKDLGIDKTAGQEDEVDTDSPPADGKSQGDDNIKPVGKTVKKAKDMAKAQRITEPSSSKDTRAPTNSRQSIFQPRPDWHAAELPPLPMTGNALSVSSQGALKNLHSYALDLLKAENDRYHSYHVSSSSSHRFMSTIMASGTMSDKISALTLVIQESPLHTMKAFENLLTLAKKRNRGQAISALGALKDLLAQGEVLPATRKLRTFSNQPSLLEALQGPQAKNWKAGQALPGSLKDVHLVFWVFEDWLKSTYYEVIKLLEIWCNDEVEFARSRALGYTYELLTQKPEQEANLLRLVINKLGDLDRKIASKASFLLLQLQTEHPLMKPVIISNIESELLFRPRQSLHAKYCGVITLNQTVLSSKEEIVAVKLLEIYFALFVALFKEPEEKKQAGHGEPKYAKKGRGKRGSKEKKKQADQAKTAEEESMQKMISALLTGVNRAFPFTSSESTVLQDHIDTLFKITHSSNFNTSVQALMLLQQLSVSRQVASDRFYRTLYESLLDPRLLTSSKQAMYLNVLFRALKADLNVKRVRAFVKRLLQMTTLHQPAFVCGAIYLITELEEMFPSLHTLIDQPKGLAEEGEEVFRDVPEEGDIPKQDSVPENQSSSLLPTPRYDSRKRDPEHCNAEWSFLWEIIPLTRHFHPSVTMFASRLVDNEIKPPKPDLSLHTLIHFLDRFVYRNAKAAPTPRGASLMQPLAGDDYGILVSKRDNSRTQAPLNSVEFLAKKPEDVSVDEVFFHKYFEQVGRHKKVEEGKAKKRRRDEEAAAAVGDDSEDDDEEGDGDGDGDDDDEIWKALVGSRPEIEGSDVDEDDDLDLEELDDDEEEEEEDGEEEEESLDMDVHGNESDSEDEASDEGIHESLFPDEEEDDDDELVSGKPERTDADQSQSQSRHQKRRKLKHLPTFASADDYADMLVDEEDGME